MATKFWVYIGKIVEQNVPLTFQMGIFLKKWNVLSICTKFCTKSWYKRFLSLIHLKLLISPLIILLKHNKAPSWSILSLCWVTIYANDLTESIKNCHIALYADDTVLYTAHSDFATSVAKMEADINSLANWCLNNGINVNTDKTKIMTFGVNKSLSTAAHYLRG